MKKYTNKILWITAGAIALYLIIRITVLVQTEWNKHPERFKPWEETFNIDTTSYSYDTTIVQNGQTVHIHMQNGEPVEVVTLRNACDYTDASDGVRTVQMLGYSMNAVAMPKDGTLTYRFDVEQDGEYIVQVALIPTQPADNGDLRFSMSIDGNTPIVYSLKEPFRSEEWKQNVLRGQALRQQTMGLFKGSHILTIHAFDNHIVVDQFQLRRR